MNDDNRVTIFSSSSTDDSAMVPVLSTGDSKLDRLIGEVAEVCGSSSNIGYMVHQAIRQMNRSEAQAFVQTLRDIAGMYRRELEFGDPDVAFMLKKHYLEGLPPRLKSQLQGVTDVVIAQMTRQLSRIKEQEEEKRKGGGFLGIFGR
jgi:hypothetical protein